jgi:hypothetical protein
MAGTPGTAAVTESATGTSTQPATGSPAATPSPGAGQAAPAQTTEPPWYSGFKDAALKGYAELNHWKDPEAAAKDAQEAQKLIGVPKEDLLRVPRDFGVAKPEELDAIYTRLGRPKTAAEYNLPKVEGGDEFAGKMAPLLHTAGLNQRQVDVIANGWNSYINESVAAQERAQEQQEQLDMEELHKEWPGETFNHKQELARRAVREFIVPLVGEKIAGEKASEILGKVEDAIGTSAFMKLFALIGEKAGVEDKFVDGGRNGFDMSPAAARARIDMLKLDREWSAKVIANPGGPERQEWDRLIRIGAQGA